jgi:hypothetical protein
MKEHSMTKRKKKMTPEPMTHRERIIAALERKPVTGRVPHFELLVYPGMRLARYELMLDVWRREGNYEPVETA